MKLVLFDVDGTLIKKGYKGHNEAFSVAFRKVYNVDTSIDIIEHHGMTDQQVIIEVLKKNGLEEKAVRPKLKECMEVMVDSFNKIIDKYDILVLDGVRELLEELEKQNILIGLVTGNLEPIARGKMKKIGLDHYFKVGGFGNDDISRTKLVKIAIERAENNFDFVFDKNVFLVDDAVRGIVAGKEAGVKTIGVATGIYSAKELKDAGADFVLNDLRDKKKFLNIVFG